MSKILDEKIEKMSAPERETLALRHTAEHVLHTAMQNLYPKLKKAMGPATDEGFYFDFDLEEKINETDFPKIEKEMQRLIAADLPMVQEHVEVEKARTIFKDNPYKLEWVELINQRGEAVSLYKMGEADLDLCSGPHLPSTGKIKAFKLLSVAGAYWHGDEKNKMLTRIYGTAYPTQEELDHYLWQQEEAKKRDHRKIGKELNLFIFSDLVGRGLPLFTPKGTILREQLNDFSQALRIKQGFEKVWIPHLTKRELYEVSGHWDKFKDELLVMDSKETGDVLVIKPMNCPHHQQIFASQPRSYKDLPIKYLETTTVYRDEKAGEMIGLARVRSVTQDDSHIFCTPEQIFEVYVMLINIVKEFYGALGMTYRARLSFRNLETPEKYLGKTELWDKAQAILLKIAKESGLDYYEAPGEAAFYGPKIDIMVTDSLGREWQLATPQLDFVQPERFGLTYIDAQGKDQVPVMIHFALMGSIERFLSVYIEHTAGAFTVWLAPVQAVILPVSDKFLDYAKNVLAELQKIGVGEAVQFRLELNNRNETLSAKIRDAQKMKIPYMLIVGEKEQTEGTVSVRLRNQKETAVKKTAEFADELISRIKKRALDL